jgi:hypothetical protein
MQVNPMEEEMFLVDSCTTNTILRQTKHFRTLTKRTGNILTITGRNSCIVGSGKANIILFESASRLPCGFWRVDDQQLEN